MYHEGTVELDQLQQMTGALTPVTVSFLKQYPYNSISSAFIIKCFNSLCLSCHSKKSLPVFINKLERTSSRISIRIPDSTHHETVSPLLLTSGINSTSSVSASKFLICSLSTATPGEMQPELSPTRTENSFDPFFMVSVDSLP